MNEEWRPVVGYDGYYEVSDSGVVRSVPRMITSHREVRGIVVSVDVFIRGRVLSLHRKKCGHITVALCKSGQRVTAMVHTLVLSAFLGPRPSGHDSLHLDGDPANNKASNLAWGTRLENIHQAIADGRFYKGEDMHNSKLSEADVREIRRLHGSVSALSLSRKFGVSHPTIRKAQLRKTWKHIN